MNNCEFGKMCEQYAVNYLICENHIILKVNFYCKYGELDIISIDYSNEVKCLVFTEVKGRKSIRFGSPIEAVNKIKLQKIIKSALCFLNSSTINLPSCWRIDTIGLQLNSRNQIEELNHLKNIHYG